MSSGMPARNNEAQVVRAELLISWALRIGVIACGIIIALGLVSRLFGIGAPETQSMGGLIHDMLGGGEVAGLHATASPGVLLNGILHWQPDVLINAGLLLLIALPILRVALTTLIFLYERDWAFVVITLVVLCVLLSGLFLGKAL
jgi:uncharacterized membrane protein